ncbi:MAG TPA: hypothetical protein VNU71_16790, partial [Burkholderiaceae bacterium]|nr:hypothetical protein [Burkholderiaceae bacterium]
MIDIDFERLQRLGLTPALAQRALACAAAHASTLEGAAAVNLLRLTELHRDAVRLHDGDDELHARVLPRLTR